MKHYLTFFTAYLWYLTLCRTLWEQHAGVSRETPGARTERTDRPTWCIIVKHRSFSAVVLLFSLHLQFSVNDLDQYALICSFVNQDQIYSGRSILLSEYSSQNLVALFQPKTKPWETGKLCSWIVRHKSALQIRRPNQSTTNYWIRNSSLQKLILRLIKMIKHSWVNTNLYDRNTICQMSENFVIIQSVHLHLDLDSGENSSCNSLLEERHCRDRPQWVKENVCTEPVTVGSSRWLDLL